MKEPAMRYAQRTTAFILGIAILAISSTLSLATENGIFAQIHTGKGAITAKLFYKRAPMTVMNFVGLAEGAISWRATDKEPPTRTPLYKGLIFHVVKDFMIQTGDPTGTGKGGPGYLFDDEFHPALTHARAGTLSMATRGRNTNGSQFIITTMPAPWLDYHNPVFGEVISGLDIAKKIARGDRLDDITIIRKGKEAKAFNPARAHVLADEVKARLKKAAKKTIPEATAPVDPVKIPGKDQPLVSPADFDFLVIAHTQMKVAAKLGRVFYYDRKGAIEAARKLVRLARGKGVDFKNLIARFSDMKRDTTSRGVKDSPFAPAALKPIFRLKPGQISDPVDLPTGIYIFRRLTPRG
jgi:peptidylprolyl isomerase